MCVCVCVCESDFLLDIFSQQLLMCAVCLFLCGSSSPRIRSHEALTFTYHWLNGEHVTRLHDPDGFVFWGNERRQTLQVTT